MYDKNLPNRGGIRQEFVNGVDEFVKFASVQYSYMDNQKIRCPCRKCRNMKYLETDEVTVHLYRHGFMDNYFNWIYHGEAVYVESREQASASTNTSTAGSFADPGTQWANSEDLNWGERLVYGAAGPSFVTTWGDQTDYSSHYGDAGPSVQPPFEEAVPTSHGPNDVTALSERFFETLRAAQEPLYSGCDDHSQLSAVAELVNIKAEHNFSERCFNSIADRVNDWLPRDNSMPVNFYSSKKMMRELGLPVVKIDCCKAGCMLYWKEDASEEFCKFCGESRYKERRGRGDNPKRKKIPQAVLRYLPLTPRLQRLYASDVTAEHMTWHANHETDEGVMCHPSDAEAWKNFDRTHPDFASEARNIRLGLCSDGFAPHGQYGATYSCWPVIVTPYNLPPGMCMKSPYMFLSLIIPGPKNPKKLIDVYLQPLIEELKVLW